MKVLSMLSKEETSLVGIVNGIPQSTLTITNITQVPCVYVYNEETIRSTPKLKRLTTRETTLIEHKTLLQLECSHNAL